MPKEGMLGGAEGWKITHWVQCLLFKGWVHLRPRLHHCAIYACKKSALEPPKYMYIKPISLKNKLINSY